MPWFFPLRASGACVSGGLSRIFRYEESELDPAVQAEVLLESARNEARVAVLQVLVAIMFGLWFKFQGDAFRAVAWFAVIAVVALLVDSQLRRSAAKRLLGMGPRPKAGRRS
jgi:hypothetical protein